MSPSRGLSPGRDLCFGPVHPRSAFPLDRPGRHCSTANAYVLADREYYVSHDYNQTQAFAAMIRVEGGTVVLYANRTTTDQLGGFGTSTKQSIGCAMMAKQIRAIFEKSRARIGKN